MNSFLLIAPELSLFIGALYILMRDVFFGKKNGTIKPYAYFASAFAALVFCVVSAVFLFQIKGTETQNIFNNMFVFSPFAGYFKSIILFLLTAVILMATNFLYQNKEIAAEFVALLMIATTGSMLLVSANDFITFYLSLELQSLSLYLMAAIKRKSSKSSEAGMKYFILGSVASGLILYGISLIYGFSGTTNFIALNELYTNNFKAIPLAALFGFILVLTGIFFKLSAAPFHMWVADVYQGSAAIVTTFFATVVKFVSVVILVRLFINLSINWPGLNLILIAVALLSLIVGSFGAIKQQDFRRLLAYSSIGHVGFVLLAVGAYSFNGMKAALLYIIIYAILSLGNFGFLNLIESKKANDDDYKETDEENGKIFNISALSGLAKTNPIMAACLTIMMFSTAGIPPLAGFFAKFYAVTAIVERGYFAVAAVAILFSVVSAYYYLRIVKIMYFDESKEKTIAISDDMAVRFLIIFAALVNLLFLAVLNPLFSSITSVLNF